MHSLITMAGFLALVAMAFGQRAASVVAAIIVLGVPLTIVSLLVWKHLITIGALPPV